jgi:nucleolar protein 58
MYVLFETAGGFALFKVIKDKKVEKVDSLHEDFATPEGAAQIVKLKAFKKFKDTKDALKSVEKLMKGKLSKGLEKFLDKNLVHNGIEEEICVADNKLVKTIQEKLGLTCKNGDKVNESRVRVWTVFSRSP